MLQKEKSINPYLALARLYLQRQEFEEAEENVRKAIDLNRDEVDAWAMLGHINYASKAYPPAQAAYETVLHIGKGNWKAIVDLIFRSN